MGSGGCQPELWGEARLFCGFGSFFRCERASEQINLTASALAPRTHVSTVLQFKPVVGGLFRRDAGPDVAISVVERVTRFAPGTVSILGFLVAREGAKGFSAATSFAGFCDWGFHGESPTARSR